MRASDTWSPITDVTWRYGDGTSERGASVRHAYARAGTLPRHGASCTTPPATRRSARSSSSRRRSHARLGDGGLGDRDRGGLRVAIACLPSNPSVTGTVTAAIPGAKPVPFRCSVARTRARRSCRARATRGKRVVVRVTGLDLAGLPHLRASTLATL